MASPRITMVCPHCKRTISADEAFTHQFDAQLKSELESRLQEEKRNMWPKALAKAQEKSLEETKLLKEELEEKQKQLQEARQIELEMRKQRNQLEEDKKTFELERQRQLDEERNKIREDMAKQMLEEHRLKDAEKERKLQEVLRVNEELRIKLQQGSQQSQGEVLELELEGLLTREFPYDEITPVAKGVNGADIVHTIRDHHGQICGTILWETKNTKNWQPNWLQKLKNDQRAKSAEVAVIVSSAMPDDIKNFGIKEKIYISNYICVLGVAKLLRTGIIEVAATKSITVGASEKMQVVYNYIHSTAFRHRVEAIIEGFVLMEEDLRREKRMFTLQWAKREKQIQKVIDNTIGMHGDLQGIIGSSLPTMPLLEATTEEAEVTTEPSVDSDLE